MKNLLLLLLVTLAAPLFSQSTYYLDDVSGSDSYDGLSPSTAFLTVDHINTISLLPGDSVLFRRGSNWIGNLTPKGSGNKKSRIVIGAYGKGPAPVIDARGKIGSGESDSYTIRLFNQEYIEIRDLTIKNFMPFEIPRSVKTRSKTAFTNSEKLGIYIQGEDCGTLNDIMLVNLEVCKVNGSMNTKHNGGIFMEISKSKDPKTQLPSNFANVQLKDCYIHDVDRTGFSNISVWANRSLKSKKGDLLANGQTHDWYPSEGFIIRNNRFERTGANALIIRVAEGFPVFAHSREDST